MSEEKTWTLSAKVLALSKSVNLAEETKEKSVCSLRIRLLARRRVVHNRVRLAPPDDTPTVSRASTTLCSVPPPMTRFVSLHILTWPSAVVLMYMVICTE